MSSGDKVDIHVLGDSHTMYFLGHMCRNNETEIYETDEFKYFVRKLGDTGPTAYGLKNMKSRTMAGSNLKDYLEKNDVENLVLVFGEVDVRAHVKKYHDGWQTRLHNSVSSYFDFIIDEVIDKVKRLFVYGVNHYSSAFRANNDLNGVVDAFNFALALECDALANLYDVTYFDSVKETVGEDGSLLPEFSNSNPADSHMDKSVADVVRGKFESVYKK